MKKTLLFIVLAFLAISLYAVPADRTPFIVKQSDGTMLTLVLNGDEAMHFYTTLDGKHVVKEVNGDYCYATFTQDGGFVSTGVVAHNADKRSNEENEMLSTIDYEAIKENISEAHALLSAEYRNSVATRASSASILAKGEVLVPVLLVEFSDVKFSFNKDSVDDLLNKDNYKYNFKPVGLEDRWVEGYGSARDYFIAQSDSIFRPKFVVTDIVTLPHPMAYYGKNINGKEGKDQNPQGMIRDGLELANDKIDFSQFDNDKNGEVEFVYCIYAGYSEAFQEVESEAIWPHQWKISSDKKAKPMVDNVYCDVYACSSELYLNKKLETDYGKWLAGIGTICHEFSHCLGLHDVYDVSGESGIWGMDEWDLMDRGNHVAGGYIPVGYNSYQKDVCGWKKLEVLDKKGHYSMLPQSQGGKGYKIVNDANNNEYFILENRKREGWDQTIPCEGGMMIIHVDYNADAWSKNEINVTANHPRFQIVPADNELLTYINADTFYESMAKDLWPGTTRNTEFTNTSIPAAKVYKGDFLNKPVTNIKYENYVASFDFLGGVIATPEIMPATDIQPNSFVANWNVAENALEYVVELYRLTDAVNGNGDTKELLEENFINCNKSATPIQDYLDEYMSTSGWSGNAVYSENGMLRIGAYNTAGYLTTPLLEISGDVVLRFDVKRNNNDASVKLTAEVYDAADNVIATKEVTAEGTAEVRCEIDGYFYVRFSTDSEAAVKRALIDNVVIAEVLPFNRELMESVTTSNNSYKFENLSSGKYAYRVKGIDEEGESEYSEYADLILGTDSVVEVAGAENGLIEIFTLDGVMIYCGRTEQKPNLSRGIYIIKSDNDVKKILFR